MAVVTAQADLRGLAHPAARFRRSSRSTPEQHSLDDILTVNFGPNHPSTHGVLRLVVDLDGETVAGIRAVIGYLHTGFEKNMEAKTWWKSVTYAPRIDYVSFQANELVYVLAVEELLGLEIPRKAVWARMALAELNRIHSHLVWLGTSALEIGAISLFWYAFDDRDGLLDLFEMVGGTRMHTRYFQVGGLAEDIPPGFTDEARKFCDAMPKSVDEYEAILDRNAIWLERTKGDRPPVGGRRARARASRARCCARSGVELGPAEGHALPRLRRGRLRRARLPERRRLRPIQGPHGRDARVRAHRPAVPRPARRDGRRAVDRGRPQGRAAAPPRAAHVDGVADPPLQDRHRGLHRARRARSTPSSSRRAASPGATSSPTAARGRGA